MGGVPGQAAAARTKRSYLAITSPLFSMAYAMASRLLSSAVPMDRPKLRSPLAYEVLAYLADHPAAQDTLEGIVQWWLLERYIADETKKVQEAILELTARGLLLERRNGSARLHYRIDPGRLDEVRSLLTEREEV